MEAVIFVGAQGAGKTTYYRRRFFDTHVRISLDMLRTRAREQILIRACLLARQPFVVDNTNALASQRAVYIGMATESRFRIVAYYFRTELREALRRNAARKGRQAIPAGGVIGTFKRLQPPTPEEGFDEIHTVALNAAGEFEVS
jgi:predicted kinase